MSRARRGAFRCPHCGAQVARGALACPGCGSDEASGWSEDAGSWAGDLPAGYGGDDAEDSDEAGADAEYEDFLRREGLAGDGRPPQRPLRERRIAAVCLLLVICIVLWLVWR
ncbi:MAG TPA: zinc-ribbon domain-containing protein [Planctomycetota bacterium]|nr:zinc-ribbon domain-containing protein [Planctomycetota bacterium]